jgi:hypothetical protein
VSMGASMFTSMICVGGAATGGLSFRTCRGDWEGVRSGRLVLDFFLAGSSFSSSWLSDHQATYSVEHEGTYHGGTTLQSFTSSSMIKLLFMFAFTLFSYCQVSNCRIQNKKCETHFSQLLQCCTGELAECCFIHVECSWTQSWCRVLGCVCTVTEGCFIPLTRCCLQRTGSSVERHGGR